MEVMRKLTCEEAVREFFAYLDRALSGEVLEALETHLRECLDCCDRLQFSRRFDHVVKARLAEGTMPADVEERLRERLAKLAVDATADS
jgi:Putative zinc-finger